jgi:hypothetical protein
MEEVPDTQCCGHRELHNQIGNLVYLLVFYYFQTTQEVYMRRIYLLFNYLISTDVYLVTQLLYIYIYIYMR